jgi:hypothetical protein
MTSNAVVCVDASGKPESIPLSSWVKKDELYHILKVSHSKHSNEYFFELEEIDLTPFAPYKGFKMNRFRPFEGDKAIKELIESINVIEIES